MPRRTISVYIKCQDVQTYNRCIWGGRGRLCRVQMNSGQVSLETDTHAHMGVREGGQCKGVVWYVIPGHHSGLRTRWKQKSFYSKEERPQETVEEEWTAASLRTTKIRSHLLISRGGLNWLSERVNIASEKGKAGREWRRGLGYLNVLPSMRVLAW